MEPNWMRQDWRTTDWRLEEIADLNNALQVLYLQEYSEERDRKIRQYTAERDALVEQRNLERDAAEQHRIDCAIEERYEP